MLHIKLKLTTHAANGSKYFAYRHTLDPGMRSKDQTISFAETGHVAYKIKGN